MADLYRDVVAILKANGYQLLRSGKGSHEIWHNAVTGRKVTVPRTTKSRHTASEILKQADLPKAF